MTDIFRIAAFAVLWGAVIACFEPGDPARCVRIASALVVAGICPPGSVGPAPFL